MYFPTCMVYIILKADAFSDAFAAEKDRHIQGGGENTYQTITLFLKNTKNFVSLSKRF